MSFKVQSRGSSKYIRIMSVILLGLCVLYLGYTCFAGVESNSGNRASLNSNNSISLSDSENRQWSLEVHPETGLPQVKHRQTGFIWNSMPSDINQLNKYWLNVLNSAFIVQYLNESGVLDTLLTGQSSCIKQVAVSPSSISCTFRFSNHPLRFQVVYSLIPDGRLRVTIPFHTIEDPRNKLLNIRVLPYFGSLSFQSRGYLVLPDGCGGLIKPNHPTKIYSATRIYGQRCYWDINDRKNRVLKVPDYPHTQNIFYNLPLFGVVKENQALLGVVHQGQFQAELGTEITPVIMQTAVSSRLIFREITYDMFGRLLASPLLNRQDRIVDYYFLSGQEASYVGIAQKYRNLLFASLKQSPLPDLLQTEYRLRLFMGVKEQYLDTNRLISFTSFKQAESILQDMHQKGIRNVQVILAGWTNRGYLGDNPRHFPPDRKFGGTTGLKRLINLGKKLGYSIGLVFNNSYTFKNSQGFKRSDTVKDFQGIPVDIGFGMKEYLFCPRIAWQQFTRSDLAIIRELQLYGNIFFEGLNQGAFVCYDKNHLLDSQAAVSIIHNSFETVSKTNPVAVDALFDWMKSSVKAVYDLPTTCSEDCDEAIPLTPLIFHGMVPYSFEPLNTRSDGRREFLKMVEYGGIPNAFLTAKSVADMVYAKHNLIFSGKYKDWRSNLNREYRIYQQNLRPLQYRTMIGHQSLAKNIYLTSYKDGTKTIVNYSTSNFIYRSTNSAPVTVKALDYLVIGRNHKEHQ